MQKRSTRILATLLAGLLVFASLACGGEENNSNNTTNNTKTNNTSQDGLADGVIDPQDLSADIVIPDREEDPNKVDYVVNTMLTPTVKITVKPGVVIAFKSGSGLYMEQAGQLIVEGTMQKPVVFKAQDANWHGVSFNATPTHNLAYLTIDKAGASDGFGANLYVKTGAVEINNTTISNSAGHGVLIEDEAKVNSASGGNAITASTNASLSTTTTTTGMLGKFTYDKHVELRSEQPEFEGDITLADIGVPYYLTKDHLNVTKGTLTIDAGVQLGFAPQLGIDVSASGTLKINGEQDKEVRLYAWDTASGWNGVLITSTSANALSYATIENAGANKFLNAEEPAALTVGYDTNVAKAALKNVTLKNSANYGFYTDGWDTAFTSEALTITGSKNAAANLGAFSHMPMIGQDISITGNEKQLIVVRDYDGTKADLDVHPAGVPFVITEGLSVDGAHTFTVHPGAELRFENDAFLSISGKLVAEGTAEKPVVLGASSDSAGGWKGIWIKSDKENSIKHAVVKQGGGGEFDFIGAKANIVVGTGVQLEGKLDISDSTVSESGGYGIYKTATGSYTAANLMFSGNADDNEGSVL